MLAVWLEADGPRKRQQREEASEEAHSQPGNGENDEQDRRRTTKKARVNSEQGQLSCLPGLTRSLS